MQEIQTKLPQYFNISSAQIIDIATEYWRLSSWLAPFQKHPDLLPLKHTTRRLKSLLEEFEITVLDLTGQPYDEGLSVEVLDTLQQEKVETVPQAIITEMITPVILWRGILLKPGKVVITRFIHPNTTFSQNAEEQNNGNNN